MRLLYLVPKKTHKCGEMLNLDGITMAMVSSNTEEAKDSFWSGYVIQPAT